MKEKREADITDYISYLSIKTNALANMLIEKGLFSENEYIQELYGQIDEKILDEETKDIIRNFIKDSK